MAKSDSSANNTTAAGDETSTPDATATSDNKATPDATATSDNKTTPDAATSEKTFTKADLDRELARQKKELEKAAAKAKEMADLDEAERRNAEIAELKTQIRMRDARDAVASALEKAGARSTGLMFAAVKDDLEFDDKGQLVNLDDIVSSLKSDYPELFGRKKTPDGIDAGTGQEAPGDVLTKEKLSKMTPAEIQKLDWDDVKKVLSEN